jgi:hypothetical protein
MVAWSLNKAGFLVGVSDRLRKLLCAGVYERDPVYKGLEIRGKGDGDGESEGPVGNGRELCVGVDGAITKVGVVIVVLPESSDICLVAEVVRNNPSNSASLYEGV